VAKRRLADGTLVLAVRGSLNGERASRLNSEVTDCVIDAEKRLVVDLTELDYLDSDGIETLLGARRLARRNGCEMTITGLEDAVRRMVGLD
jgi:anti-sigma B factor antagonist